MPGTFKITTFGCQMNKSDSERIQSLLVRCSLKPTDNEYESDVLIFNTCSVRQKAEDRVYGIHRSLEQLKQADPKRIIALTGCMAGRDHDGNIRRRLPLVDLFFPTTDIIHLPRMISGLRPDLIDPNQTEAGEFGHYLSILPSYANRFQAYLAISNGCNKFCTYCVVPYARGRQKDRPLAEVMEEARTLARNGCLELTLLGQTVNLYNPPDKEFFSRGNPYEYAKNAFAALMWELNQLEGIQRIHFTAPHPQYMDSQTIDALTMKKNINYLHLPAQSGSNHILKRMNRPYTREYYISKIDEIRSALPTISIGTDIIVGFSGETEDDFDMTCDLYRRCDFDIAYLAQYSVRSGTAASRMYKDDVSAKDKKRRWDIVQQIMEETVLKKNQVYAGTTVSVLVDSFEQGLCSGNSREMKRVIFRGHASDVGTIQDIRIDRAIEWVLYGSICEKNFLSNHVAAISSSSS
ncbi:tRNA (N6-isopentenyl adenosine(37)-C2)-methylthiotransferase MiaB [Candidatus Uhrbacteria bacterium]|nr:tRNA (N6-isopentenyl adenosine(37)-C2)-methylthiotransferase MiaB [Candidatus Uhrbacteria bacterium]